MKQAEPNLLVTTSPFLKAKADTVWIMWQVSLSLVPIVLAATWYFGLSVPLVILAACLGAMVPEWVTGRNRRSGPHPLRDGTALLTGLLLALTLPPGIPLWMAFVGGLFAVLVGKTVFGGIGQNVFNPALAGRAFLQAAFPATMTTWSSNGGWDQILQLKGASFTLPFLKAPVDAITTATPLATLGSTDAPMTWTDMALGGIPGSIGETSALLILLCGGYLLVRGIANWRIPLSILTTVWIFGTALHWLNPAYPSGTLHLAAGGLMLGALYMATDPVTSPITQAGLWVFGALIGILVVLIRVFGGLPEGVMYAILLANAATPLINRITQPRTFGTRFKPSFTR